MHCDICSIFKCYYNKIAEYNLDYHDCHACQILSRLFEKIFSRDYSETNSETDLHAYDIIIIKGIESPKVLGNI